MENINLEEYKVFYYVAKNKNVSKTAKEMLISQPAITQTIKKLEQELNYKLFFRTSRGMELTEYGEKLYQNIRNSIECLDNSKQFLDGLKNKPQIIKIGGGSTLLKYNALASFKKFNQKYPNIKIAIERGITSELLKDLENNLLDLVLFNMPVKVSENIEAETIENVQDVFVANTSVFSNLKDKKIKLNDLAQLPFVLQASVSSSGKYLNSILKKHHISINNTFELDSYDLVLSFVKAGLGIGFINQNHIKKELANNELFILDIDINIPPREIGIAYNKKNINNEYIKYFIATIKK